MNRTLDRIAFAPCGHSWRFDPLEDVFKGIPLQTVENGKYLKIKYQTY